MLPESCRALLTVGLAMLVLAGCTDESPPAPEPSAAASPSGQRDAADGDALVAGTRFNATATVRCVTREG